METIPTPLIEKALELTGKKMEDMQEPICLNWIVDFYNFSIEKFCYYLLSPEFIEKYYQSQRPWYTPDQATLDLMSWEFGYAIYEYQSGNSEPLVYLLSKI